MEESLLDMYVIPEETIKKCADELSYTDNNFKFLLEKHKELKDAGLTPLFLTKDMLTVRLTTVEFLKNKLH